MFHFHCFLSFPLLPIDILIVFIIFISFFAKMRNWCALHVLCLSFFFLSHHYFYIFVTFSMILCIIHSFVLSLLFSFASFLSSSFSYSYVFKFTPLSLGSHDFVIDLMFDEHNLLSLAVLFVVICFSKFHYVPTFLLQSSMC